MKRNKYFIRNQDMKEELMEGGILRRIYSADNLQIVEYHFPAFRTFPPHSHDRHEQMGYLLSGRIGLRIGGIEMDLTPGMWYCAPAGTMHNAWTYDDPAVLLDIFSPPREDLR